MNGYEASNQHRKDLFCRICIDLSVSISSRFLVPIAMVAKVCASVEFSKLQPSAAQTAAMAHCLMQAAQIDQAGLKAELVTMPAEGQRTVQELLRAHVSAGRTDTAATGSIPRVTLAHKKIELKLKF